jgi:NAD(P)-dependent dehydrogenase (short-subunit alcohol dehydrogenase family)
VHHDLKTKYPHLSIATVCADIGSLTGPNELIRAVGGKQIDILINNAGTSGNQYLPEVTAAEFERQYNVNVRGPLLLVQAALPFLPNDRSGRIVNTSSISSSQGLKAQSVYGGTKAALEAMTRTWARELAERATVNAINPGPVETRMCAPLPFPVDGNEN